MRFHGLALLRVPQWPERKIAGHASVSVTLKIYAEEFDKAMHRDDLIARINKAAFSSVEGVLTSGRGGGNRPAQGFHQSSALVRLTGSYQARLVREHHRLNTIAESQLRQDVRDVRPHGRLTHKEPRCNLGVGEAARDLGQHLELSLRQVV